MADSARERRRIIDAFVDEAFAGIAPDAPGARIAEGMRVLPDEPDRLGPEKARAWEELAELVADDDFRRRVRQMAVEGAEGGDGQGYDVQPVIEHAGGAVAAGVAPGSPEGQEILGKLIPAGTPAAERDRMATRVEVFTDRRVERFWELMGVLNDRPPFPSGVPAFEWFAAALRAH
ncbi:hypothetical protein Ssi03_73820 [Sphaerisporangium siamense]|uniref:Uncharacterized protein n=1 Tax=Sphaerisporangium siamense TaxID=795645 RepID=A0A7W7DG06_9ACTN|nr:hypothetical protein [Sphaerisporangium siamense]MBB4706097.1 hypothetical protein [Sphaerisporangium siamense]GII89392.1 hypothetical protein Ssi03_73820 [Sphaerisporangium siamense]